MRTVRHKTVRDAKKRIPYGIERQQVLLELVERRLAQVEVIRDALCRSYDISGGEISAVTILWHGQEETIERPEAWLTVYDDVERGGDAVTRELLRRRFRDEPYWKTCDALYLSHSTYYHNVKDILSYALACATAYGIVDPRPVVE